MEIKQYIAQKKRIYLAFMEFLENSSEDDDNDFQNLLAIVKTQKILENKEEFYHFLRLVINFFDNYHRDDTFFDKIKQILVFFQKEIKHTFSNSEIFEIFNKNKLILLFLIDKEILMLDSDIIRQLFYKSEKNGFKYSHFFYPEIEKSTTTENSEILKQELLQLDPNIFTDYDENRRRGENESYICSLIRSDSVEEFDSYINKNQIPLSIQIKSSLFETNRYLIDNNPSLIEYAAFYGSIQIFQYLKFNDVDMTPQLWDYAVHSKNAELIHLLEQNNVPPNEDIIDVDHMYKSCLLESIKCNHNDFAMYIQNNLMFKKKIDVAKMKDQVIDYALNYCNYSYLPNDYEGFEFVYFCRYNYYNIVNLIIKMRKDDFEKNRILKMISCFYNIS